MSGEMFLLEKISGGFVQGKFSGSLIFMAECAGGMF